MAGSQSGRRRGLAAGGLSPPVRCFVPGGPVPTPASPARPPAQSPRACRISRSRPRLMALYLRSSAGRWAGKQVEGVCQRHGAAGQGGRASRQRWTRAGGRPACAAPTLRRQLPQLLLQQLELAQLQGLGDSQVLHLRRGGGGGAVLGSRQPVQTRPALQGQVIRRGGRRLPRPASLLQPRTSPAARPSPRPPGSAA